MIMAELDPSPKMPLSPLEAARIDKATLQKLGLRVPFVNGRQVSGAGPRHPGTRSFQCTIGSPGTGARKYGMRVPLSDPM